MIFRARNYQFNFPRPAVVMGVVNVTPDSFSDGGKFLEPAAAVEQALKLVEEGAEILDIGGESTRPGAQPVDEAEEIRRVIPVIERLAIRVKVPISIDTYKPAVARAALDVGASIINDVGAATRKGYEMWELAAQAHAGYVLMHAQGTPLTMQQNPKYGNVIRDVSSFFSEKLAVMLNEVGLTLDHTILDVGIGFGKTPRHNLQLLAGLRSFTKWRRPLAVGISRKSFIEKVLGKPVEDRLPASLACTTLAVVGGASVVRTHDVAETLQAIRMAEAFVSEVGKELPACSTCGRRGL